MYFLLLQREVLSLFMNKSFDSFLLNDHLIVYFIVSLFIKLILTKKLLQIVILFINISVS